jgi:hypothetical protein
MRFSRGTIHSARNFCTIVSSGIAMTQNELLSQTINLPTMRPIFGNEPKGTPSTF